MKPGWKAAASRLGQVVGGKYRLLSVLGLGGMGAVFEAQHEITKKHVAIKILHKQHSESPQHAARFLREAQAASAIKHPAVCDVLDAGQDDDGTLYLVLELLRGTDLGSAVAGAPRKIAEYVGIFVQVLDGLDAAHTCGIVHRDIKPENLFLATDEDGAESVKILDFGVAKLTTVPDAFTTVTGTVLGTPFYMSPEQARGDVSVDARSEVWSVGAVMFHCLTGRPPYDEQNYNKLILRIMTERAPSLATVAPGLPAWLVATVDRALEPDPHKRWSSAALMAAALRAGEVEEGSSASLRFAPRRERRGSIAPAPMPGAVTPRPDRALPASARSIDETAPTIDTTGKQPAQTPAQWERAAPATSSRVLAFGALALAGLAIVVGGTALAVMGGEPPPAPAREHAAPRVPDPSPSLDVAPPIEPPAIVEAEVADAGATAVTVLADAGVGARRPGRDRAIAGGAEEQAGTMAPTTMRRLGPIRVYE